MEANMLGAAVEAFALILDPFRLLILASGVLMGLFLGVIPGIGGLVGMALLLPFTFTLDPYAAFALLLGLTAVTNTSDTITAVLFGVPGSSAAQATVMDGNPMAKKGEAGRALAAAFTASLMGGVFGALLLALTIPLLRPAILYIGAPELLAFSIFGISMVAVLSGSAPIRGLIAAGFGVMLSMVGPDTQTATYRWTFDQLYLWEGLPLIPLVLGLFALPELAELAVKRSAIASGQKFDTRSGTMQGIKDVFQNFWLMVRCGGLGAAIGAVPGIGGSVVDWLAYGHARQTVKGGNETFGTGDVRGVIAPESANNSITAGLLVPTVAFGVPGSASMALLLGVLMIHGLVPGRDMLTTNLSVTYSMVWSIAFANILGAGICLAFSGQVAKIATLRHTFIIPAVVTIVIVGAFQASRSWGDLYTLLAFGVIGWFMKQLKWPRPPLILGFVLGALIERYMFLTFNLYDTEWVYRPIVLTLIVISAAILISPIFRQLKALGGVVGIARNFRMPIFELRDLSYVLVFLVAAFLVYMAADWPRAAKYGPMFVGSAILVLAAVGFLNQIFSRSIARSRFAEGTAPKEIHMDAPLDNLDMPRDLFLRRTARFLAYLLGFLVLTATIGFLPSVPIMVAAYMVLEGNERWHHIAIYAAAVTAFVYLVFDQLMRLPWPPTLLGSALAALS